MKKKFETKEIVLKNNSKIIIREAQLTDAEQLLFCIKKYIPQSDYIPKYEQEIKLTIEQERDWIQSFLKNHNSLLLVAEFDNEIIGNIDLTGSRRQMMEHTAVIGMGMLAEWRNIGLGTALLNEIICWSKLNPILEIIWLQVYIQNEIGLNLYRKMGFLESGTIKNFFKKEGTYFDNLTMTLDVHKE